MNIPLMTFLIGLGASTACAEVQSGQILIKSIQGGVTVSSDHSTWSAATPEMVLGKGAVIKTASDSSADLVFEYSGTVLRMTPGSVLELTKLDKEAAGESTIVDTSVTLKSGSVMGSQRKLAKPSRFEIHAPWGVATIVGTEYMVSADGKVACYSGEVAVTRNSEAGAGVKAAVSAGYTIDRLGTQVLPIGLVHMQTVALDMAAVRANAKACNDKNKDNGKGNGKDNGKGNGKGNGNGNDDDHGHDGDHEPPVSPIHHGHGHDNDHGRDNDHGHDNDRGHDNDQGNGHGNGHGQGKD